MFIKVGDQKSINLDRLGALSVKLDASPEHCAYAIFYGKNVGIHILAHYSTEKQCNDVIDLIMESIKAGDTVCNIPGEDPSMYKSIDVTTTFGTNMTLRYAPECMGEFMDQFYVLSKKRGHRIETKCYYPRITGRYENRERAVKELESFKEAVKNELPSYEFTLGNAIGVWYADD